MFLWRVFVFIFKFFVFDLFDIGIGDVYGFCICWDFMRFVVDCCFDFDWNRLNWEFWFVDDLGAVMGFLIFVVVGVSWIGIFIEF